MGGGSADAGATLRGLKELWALDISTEALEKIALSLGADVPICLHSTHAMACGIGEQLSSVSLPACAALIVNPGVEVSTKAVFEKGFSQFSDAKPDTPTEFTDFKALISALSLTKNDLRANAEVLAPEITHVLDTLRTVPTCGFTQMSGSGATCFGLFETVEKADAARVLLAQKKPAWHIYVTRLVSLV
jgi:4-diphosphocytidyl-2-C-methyl-D-erythritol kinase